MTIEPRWTNDRAARLGYLLGLGRTVPSVVATLGDVTVEQIKKLRTRWNLKPETDARASVPVPVELNKYQRRILAELAREIGIETEEWLRRVCACAIEDKLYDAITDGRYD